jgi:hypothetical protein
MEPIFLGCPFGATSGLPEFMRKRCDFCMSECGDPMFRRSCLSLPVSVLRLLQGLPGMLVSRQVILLPMLLSHPMGMRGAVVQFGGPLVVLVV